MAKRSKSSHHQANQYDKIWRENMQAALPGIIEKVLKINVLESRELPDKLLVTKQREVDALREVIDLSGNKFILHIEIQVKNEPDMVYRMAEYRIMLERLYRLPVKQYVIYIGEGKSIMIAFLHSEGLHYEYNLISFSQISYKLFLSSDRPEERLLAILANFDGEDPETVITTVLTKVRQATESDFSENQYLRQLRILIQLRNLTKQFDNAMEKVSEFFKEERDPFFQKGVIKGIEKGIEQGIDLKSQEIVQNLITTLGLSDEQAAGVAGVSIEFVREIRAKMIKK